MRMAASAMKDARGGIVVVLEEKEKQVLAPFWVLVFMMDNLNRQSWYPSRYSHR